MAHPLFAVTGPTAAGKSHLAVSLALRCGGEIVNCDSMQVYRGFDIGTAKSISTAVPHHLFDILDPTESFNAGDYARRATAVLAEIASRGKTPVLVGGTGLYLRALVDGLAPAPQRNSDLRARLALRDASYLHRLLTRFDALSASRIHPHDKPKTIRAIEVCLEARRPMSHVWEDGRQGLRGFDVVKIGLNPPRAALYARINERARTMFDGGGLIEEVRGLLAAGVPVNAKPFEAVGYSEALAVVRETMTWDAAIDSTQRRTRHYAKRQMTWFRRERDIEWLNGFGDHSAIQELAIRAVAKSSQSGHSTKL